MKKYFFLLLSITLCFSKGYSHDLKLGFFQCYQINDNLYLQVKLDREEILEAVMKNGTTTTSGKEDFKMAIFDYVKNRLALSFNDQSSQIQFFLIEYDEDHIHLRGHIKGFDPNQSIKNIAITNTCLIEEVDGQENIVQFDLNNKKRSFRLNKQHIQTEFNY
ncbi:DUF6702 family protein [Reichenbachiella ulvae]|uniref:Uncharacterized protein n=1 Tax=Reichenbachiella ulvae TaxID=2980104 RepID=A0ABT3CSC2_9BACT|nr:DUF6702 family protein [Reichenbachiella ulvae]MCV9386522.1 hypothetical protein [Reichenbachiella ulvae]